LGVGLQGVTSSATWPFHLLYAISYTCLIRTDTISKGFQGMDRGSNVSGSRSWPILHHV